MIRVIAEKDGYTLFGNMNTWDMNYHLVDSKGNDYLIDTGDVHDIVESVDEYGGLLWEELKSLDDIDMIKECSWKTVEADDMLMLRVRLDKLNIVG